MILQMICVIDQHTFWWLELRDGRSPDGDKPFLEKVMIDWAIRNHPDDVNDEILRKIHEVAGIIGDFIVKPQSTGKTKTTD